MKNVFFSIITPVFNGKNYINEYLASLKNQSFKYWEAIIIDDKSDDNSYKFLKEATKDDKRFKIYIFLQNFEEYRMKETIQTNYLS